MPPRKKRGRAKKRGDGGNRKEELREEGEVVHETEAVDPELLQVQSTIERLARKYLNKSFEVSSHSLDIVRGNSMIVKEPEEGEEAMDVLGEGSSKEGGEEEKENRQDEPLSESSREAPGATTRRKMKDSSVVLRRVRHPRAMKKMAGSKLPLHEKASLSSPDIKLPQPTLGHSTPGDIGPSLPPPRRDSLFGFEALESPLVLSPVQSMSFLGDEESEHPSPTSVKKLLTYDIPLKKPTPRNRKQKKKGSSVAEDEWIKKLTSEFSEVDNFELAIE